MYNKVNHIHGLKYMLENDVMDEQTRRFLQTQRNELFSTHKGKVVSNKILMNLLQ